MSSSSGLGADHDVAYIVRGGNPIRGTLVPGGNKNAALPMLAACLLTRQPITLENVPAIRDVMSMLGLLEELGVSVSRGTRGIFRLDAGTAEGCTVSPERAGQIRASFLLAGPLLARCGRVELPRPGGDRIGRRPLDSHLEALQALGAEVTVQPDRYLLAAPRGLHGADILLSEMSVTATENTVMAAALASGTTVISNAASEPHVQELCRLVVAMGGSVEGIGTNVLRVEGRHELHGATARVGPDLIEVGSFIALAAVTGGDLEIVGANPADHRMTAICFGKLGVRWEVRGADLVVPPDQELVVNQDLDNAIPKIDDGPWPAFPPDLTSIAVVLATQSRGTVLVWEKLFESRLFWVDRLIAMGARLVLCDPHRVVVSGPSKLYGTELTSPDIRAGMALVIAALCAEGRSVIRNVHQIERGYQDLHTRLAALGADIERVER